MNTRLSQVRMHGIASSTPNFRALDELPETDNPETLALLKGSGFHRFGVSRLPASEMAYEAVARCLAGSGVEPRAVDALVVVTESLWDAPEESTRPAHIGVRDAFLQQLIVDLGLVRARVYTAWTAACGNLLPALSLAHTLLATNQARTVVTVASDRILPGENRVLPSGRALLSDVAAACVMDHLPGGLQLQWTVVLPCPRILMPRTEANTVLHARVLQVGLRDLDAKMRADHGLSLKDFDWIVLESLSEAMTEFLCEHLELDRKRILSLVRSDYAHAFSADLLLSLERFGSLGRFGRDFLVRPAKVAALSLSSWVLAAAAFTIGSAEARA